MKSDLWDTLYDINTLYLRIISRWDNLEDFVIYGLITLGLIVLPTQVFQGTPLFCTPCLEVSRENAVLKICRSKKVLSTTSKETALFRKLCS